MERLLDRAICENTSGSNYTEIKSLLEYIKYKIDLYPNLLALLIVNLQNKGNRTCIHCLNVMDQAMEDLGHPFVVLIAKNTTLNELVKIIHPEYEGHRYAPEVRSKVISLISKWANTYKRYPKLVQCHEKVMESEPIIRLNGSQNKDALDSRPCIGDEFSNFRLSRLVKMPTPENIDAANRIIRAMVKNEEDQIKQRMEYLEGLGTVEEHCNIINDIITKNSTHTEEDLNLLKELGSHCQDHVQKLQVECNQAVDRNDPMLDQIIQTTIHASNTLNEYQNFIKSPSEVENKQQNLIKIEQLIAFDASPPTSTTPLLDFTQTTTSNSNFGDIDIFGSDFTLPPQTVVQKSQETNTQPKKNLADEFLDDLFK